MATIDTSIYQNQPTVRLQTPFELEAGMQAIQQGKNQNRLAGMQFKEAERKDTERNMLADAYRQSYNPDGTQDRNKLYSTLATVGQGQLVPGLQKQYNEADASGIELRGKQFKLSEDKRIQSAQRLGALRGKPYQVVVQDLESGLREAVASGELSPEQAQQTYAQMIQRIPQDQAGLDAFIDQSVRSVMTPQQQTALRDPNKPFNADGTPNQAYQDYEVKRAQSGASSIQNFGSPVSAIDPATGKPVLIQPGNRGGVNVLPYAPAPKEAKPYTAEENSAAGYLGRMEAAEKLIGTLQGGELTEGTALAGAVPFVGDYAQRRAMNPTQQKYKQAADDWIRAKLRKESGAVIGADESAAEYKTYFPQPGDLPEVIAQKAQARKQAEAQIRQSAGRAGADMQAKDDARYTEKPFSKSEMEYIKSQKAKGVPESEIIRALNAGQNKKPAPAKAGGVKFLGFE